jgi:hypothetical protein
MCSVKVVYVADELMPKGRSQLQCLHDGQVTLFIRKSARQWSDEDMSALLTEAWRGFIKLAEERHILPRAV